MSQVRHSYYDTAMSDQRQNGGSSPPHIQPESAGLQYLHSSHPSSNNYGTAQTYQQPLGPTPESAGLQALHPSPTSHGTAQTYQQTLSPGLISTSLPPPKQAMVSDTAPALAGENEKSKLENQKSKRRTFLWVVLLVAVILILAAIGGGVAAKYIRAHKNSDQAAPTSIGNDPAGQISTGFNGSDSATSANVPIYTVVVPVTTDGIVTQSMVTTTLSAVVNTATTATITKAPTSSATNPCGNTLAFSASVSWAGVASPINPPQVLWLYDLVNGQACCEKCWAMSPQKCNVWGYFPFGHPMDDKVSCALVYDYPGSQVDGSCPAGRPQVGILPALFDDPYNTSGNVGGPGPCAGLIYTAA